MLPHLRNLPFHPPNMITLTPLVTILLIYGIITQGMAIIYLPKTDSLYQNIVSYTHTSKKDTNTYKIKDDPDNLRSRGLKKEDLCDIPPFYSNSPEKMTRIKKLKECEKQRKEKEKAYREANVNHSEVKKKIKETKVRY